MYVILCLIFFIIALIFLNMKNHLVGTNKYYFCKTCFFLSLALAIGHGLFSFGVLLDLEEIESIEKEIKICKQDNESIENELQELAARYNGERLNESADLFAVICSIPEIYQNGLVIQKYNDYVENEVHIKELEQKRKKIQKLSKPEYIYFWKFWKRN